MCHYVDVFDFFEDCFVPVEDNICFLIFLITRLAGRCIFFPVKKGYLFECLLNILIIFYLNSGLHLFHESGTLDILDMIL